MDCEGGTGTHSDLATALNELASGGTVFVKPGTCTMAGYLMIQNVIVKAIGAPGSTIVEWTAGSGAVGILTIGQPGLSATVTIDGIGFYNAQGSARGAIEVVDSVVEFKNCVFSNNAALDSSGLGGGAVLLSGMSTATFSSTAFQHNHAASNGGAVAVRITPNSGIGAGGVKFVACTFVNNSATELAGAIDFVSALSLNLTGCQFYNNSARAGGSLRIQPTVQTLHRGITGCIFESGRATDTVGNKGGGAIYALDAAGAYQASLTEVSSTTFSWNSAAIGGAVMGAATFHDLHFQNCSFLENRALSTQSASVAVGGALWVKGPLKLLDCTLAGNTASARLFSSGGAMYHGARAAQHSLLVQHCVFKRNKALSGAAVSVDGYAGHHLHDIQDTLFEKNQGGDAGYSGTEMSAGGAFSAASSTSQLTQCQFIANTAGRAGDALPLSPTHNPYHYPCIPPVPVSL